VKNATLNNASISGHDSLESKQIRIERWIKFFGVFCFLFVIAGLLFGAHGVRWFELNSAEGLESLGNFSGGAVAAFWSLAGVILIFIAFLGQKLELLYQKEELRLNRQELKDTREVLNEQKKEFELQNQTLLNQNFQNLFFQLLRNHADIIHHIDLGTGNTKISGRDCFKEMYGNFKNSFNRLTQEYNSELEKIEKAYSLCFDKYRIDLSHYFRNLYNVVKLIDRSDISNEDKRMYMNTLKAQLSTYELALLFYNCLSSYGSKRFKPLVEKYNPVNNLPVSELADKEHVRLYVGVEL